MGSELARQVASCGPSTLLLLDHSEYALFTIEEELRTTYPGSRFETLLGDVSRRGDCRAACHAVRPHVVYHAAAYKHVNVTERAAVPAVRSNVLGAVGMARAARDVGARFVLVSSDKAAEPRSVMGATKRMAELAVLSLASPTFRPVAVRFGNILGSSGSLVEIMARCVADRRRIPVTDPDATRFFMTAAEAVSLVLKADLIGRRAEVFWLDMGEPIRIGDLVERYLAWAGRAGHVPAGIDIIGLRPGEKVREELTTQGLAMRSTEHPRIWRARQRHIDRDRVDAGLRLLRGAAARGSASAALSVVSSVVRDYAPSPAAIAAATRIQAAASTDDIRRELPAASA